MDVKENSASSICLFEKFVVDRFVTSAKLFTLPELMKTETTQNYLLWLGPMSNEVQGKQVALI